MRYPALGPLIVAVILAGGLPHPTLAQNLAIDPSAEAQTASEQTVESRKSPWMAGGLSVMLPGAGQAYNGQWLKGSLMLGGAIGSFAVLVIEGVVCGDSTSDCSKFSIGGVGFVAFVLWSWIDAPIAATAINRRIDADQVALEIGPQLIVPQRRSAMGGLRPSESPLFHRNSGIDLSLVRVRF